MNLDNINSIDELPLSLRVVHVAKVLGLSMNTAYELCHSDGFPCVRVGRRMIIPRAAFQKWLENPFEKERWNNNGEKKG